MCVPSCGCEWDFEGCFSNDDLSDAAGEAAARAHAAQLVQRALVAPDVQRGPGVGRRVRAHARLREVPVDTHRHYVQRLHH